MPVTRHPLMSSGPADGRLGRVAIDSEAVRRLSESLQFLKSKGGAVARAFYAALFERHPGVRSLFPTDMAAQERKLIDSLVAVVEHVGDPGRLTPMLRELGKRHAGYGAIADHYRIVCALLIECMARESGSAWSDQLEAEWAQALELVSAIMIEASQERPA